MSSLSCCRSCHRVFGQKRLPRRDCHLLSVSRRSQPQGTMSDRRNIMFLPCRVFAVTAVASVVFVGITAASAQEPLRIAKQGSLEAGGEVVYCATNDGGGPKNPRW